MGNRGGGANRYKEIEDLRNSGTPPNDTLRHFLADLQMRFLIAEFVRKKHHLRSAQLLKQDESLLGKFAFDDPVLMRTISDVCLSHCLSHHELEDYERYPDRRSIRGELINVRFISAVLRISDLLDMSVDRACPLLLSAASPLPSESLAHWTAYQRITHRLVADDRIELSAECTDQDEHRFLQDWCSWLVHEIDNARAFIRHSQRHSQWSPPHANIEGPNPTIVIRPSPEASYFPSEWTLEFDRDVVFHRLVHDLHRHPNVFVIELIQNALDATRCRIHLELRGQGFGPIEDFSQLPDDVREEYPISLKLLSRPFTNPLSGEEEQKHVIVIEDHGIGMDREVIERFFLQIGRSFYTSNEFRREFGFFASSQFGIGFLSVFAASDYVTIETYKSQGRSVNEPIRIVLTGPSKYLLTERGSRSSPGTRIEIVLREKMKPGTLTGLVRNSCRRVEFPILVNDMGESLVVRSESSGQYEDTVPDVTEKNAYFSVKSFPIDRTGITGELYTFARIRNGAESWGDWNWAKYTYPSLHPQASLPSLPRDDISVNGISTGLSIMRPGYPMAARLDFRNQKFQPTLSRTSFKMQDIGRDLMTTEVESRWGEILTKHMSDSPFAQGERAWIYKQRLAGHFRLSSFWDSVPNTIKYFENGNAQHTSLDKFLGIPVFCTVLPLDENTEIRVNESIPKEEERLEFDLPCLSQFQLHHLSSEHRKKIFREREISAISESEGRVFVEWTARVSPPLIGRKASDEPIEVASLHLRGRIGWTIHKTTDETYSCLVLNSQHSMIKWLLRVKQACISGEYGLTEGQFYRLVELLVTPVRYRGYQQVKFENYLAGWKKIEGLPQDLYPPEIINLDKGFAVPDWRRSHK